MKVLLIGSYPPPLGGVSVFVKRYRRRLEQEGHTVEVLDPTALSRAELVARLVSAAGRGFDTVSLNYPSLPVMLALAALGMMSRTEVFEHNWRRLEEWNALERRVYNAFLRGCRELVLIAPHLGDYYAQHGVRLPERVRVQTAFLPPPPEDEAAILESYSAAVREFVDRSRPLIIANGFRLVFHRGVDLYGLDMCVELVAGLKKDYPEAGLLFALAEEASDNAQIEYYERVKARIAALGIERNFHFMTGQRELWPLFRRADLTVRPTATDGASVSVAEALYFGCPVVASDVTARPEGTLVFASRDGEDFQRKCRAALAAKRDRGSRS